MRESLGRTGHALLASSARRRSGPMTTGHPHPLEIFAGVQADLDLYRLEAGCDGPFALGRDIVQGHTIAVIAA